MNYAFPPTLARLSWRSSLASILAVWLLLGLSPSFAQDDAAKKKAESKEDAKPTAAGKKPTDGMKPTDAEKKPADAGKTVEVSEKEFEILIEATGTLGAKRDTPLRVDTKRWTDLRVIEAVKHGAEVKKGQALIQFDKEEIEKAIEKAEKALPTKEVALKQAKADLKFLLATQDDEMDAAERARQNAKEDYEYYQKTARAASIESAEQSLKFRQQGLDYEKEELRQLLAMYEADDLTEETEEIIITRSKQAVERSEYNLKVGKEDQRKLLSTNLPRRDLREKNQAERSILNLNFSRTAVPAAREAKKLEVEASERALDESRDALKEMKADLKLLDFVAPSAGVVAYGSITNGKATTAERVKPKLVRTGKIGRGETIMTLRSKEVGDLHLSLKEADLAHLKAGSKGFAIVAGTINTTVPVTLKSLSLNPESGGTYSAVATIDEDLPASIRPGRKAKLVFQAAFEEKALVLPSKAVHKRIRGQQMEHVVYLPAAGKERKPKAKVVELGVSNGDKVVITKGLKAGDKVLEAKP